ncbi:MAG: hypothetical protein LBS41_01730 [Streptococcaceae bacterium]|jgi:hypothetical protein|nr:hypothetical protein [Streptococcaceae bacterium]
MTQIHTRFGRSGRRGKQVAALLLLGLLLPTTVQPVLAADKSITSPSTEDSSLVSYTVGQKYRVTIPTTITLYDQEGTKGTGNGTVTIHAGNDLKLGVVEMLEVAIKAGQRLKLGTAGDENTETTGLPYEVSKGSTSGGASVAADGVAFVSADAGATTDVLQDLYIESAAPKLAGTYTGTLTFTVSVVSPALEVASITPNSDISFAGSTWRILVTDIDASVPGNQALIIKKENIGISKFHESQMTYFDSSGNNGYENSALKTKIDDYYTANIANNSELAKYVAPVTLHNPTFAEFKAGQPLSGSAYNAWSWDDWYKDERSATTLGDTKQAFALSYGDLNHTMGLSGSNSSPLLSFGDPNYFLLRSVGYSSNFAGYVYDGAFNYYHIVDDARPVRPALVINIKAAS